jgi:hypothetical protein
MNVFAEVAPPPSSTLKISLDRGSGRAADGRLR